MEHIRLQNVSFSYDKEKILDNINLTLEAKKFNTLLGPSGCGKTTILRLVAGFLTPQEGKILLGDKDITNLPPEKRNISTVFQNYALFQNMSVKQNVAYGLKIRKMSKDLIDQKCKEYLSLVRMEAYADKGIDELSGGQQQRVAIARALATEPSMLLMDEPMSNLDAALRIEMREEIREIQKKIGITTLFITHDQQEALAVSDSIAVMSKGKVLQKGTPQEIYFNPVNSKVAHAVGAVNDLTDKQNKTLADLFGREIISLRPESLVLSKTQKKESDIKG
ncbi:MAG: ABC transporter ATP-binding protein [Erysipelotrichaceae bacterium]|nr:ABC transporter ATP-binding protein [Erysipelotrichaceae bacterium]